jgi:hypothetical protein
MGVTTDIQFDATTFLLETSSTSTIDAEGLLSLDGAGVEMDGGSDEIDITTSGTVDINGGTISLN